MTISELVNYAERIPLEYRLYLRALSSDESIGLLVYIYENYGVTLKELKDKFGDDIKTIIKQLHCGGLIRQYVHDLGDIGKDDKTKYSITFSGADFLDKLIFYNF